MSDRLLTVAPRDDTGTQGEADLTRLADAVAAALREGGVTHAGVDLAVVGDGEMHALNRRWLDHDYPTDVLSFLLEEGGAVEEAGGGGWVVTQREGQVIVNPDEAARRAPEHDWPPHALPPAARELMLYAAHGALHLCGLDDATDDQRREMRRAEAAALAACGVVVPAGHAG